MQHIKQYKNIQVFLSRTSTDARHLVIAVFHTFSCNICTMGCTF